MKQRRKEPRVRWGIEHWCPTDRKWSGPLGAGWVDYQAELKLPAWVDYWPASCHTRREAREQAIKMTARVQCWAPKMRFRAVRLSIWVEVHA